MDFLEKKRRYDAVVVDFKGKLQKVKQGEDSARKLIIQIRVEILITANIRNSLDERILPLLDLIENAGESDLALNSIDCVEELSCIIRIFSKANYSKSSKPVIEKGNSDEGEVRVRLTGIKSREGKPLLILVFTIPFDEKLWAWGGRVIGDGDIVIETVPFQPKLPFDDKNCDEKEEEKDK
jgi:hypothetical protein